MESAGNLLRSHDWLPPGQNRSDDKDKLQPKTSYGEMVRYRGKNADVIELLPASMVSVDMLARNPGIWMFNCQVEDHLEAGMVTTYTIHLPKRSCPVQFTSGEFWNRGE
jgi:uncharacterized cupredoxin-like copper-binding protein